MTLPAYAIVALYVLGVRLSMALIASVIKQGKAEDSPQWVHLVVSAFWPPIVTFAIPSVAKDKFAGWMK